MKSDEIVKETEAIKQEIQMLRDLSHENIVRYFGSEMSEDG